MSDGEWFADAASEEQFDYLKEVMRTAQHEKFHGELVPLDHLRDNIKGIVYQLNNLDKIKKALFYGKELAWCPDKFSDSCTNIPHWLHDEDEKGIMLLHSIIGAATEIGEMLECLSKCIYDGKPLDIVNLKEEMGDSFWYFGLLCNILGTDFETIEKQNISKLKLRYPEKFTEDCAINRDVKAERKLLENPILENHRNKIESMPEKERLKWLNGDWNIENK